MPQIGTVSSFDVEFARTQFPAFAHAETSTWAHLENAGGSYVPSQVIDRLTDLFSHYKCQPSWDFGPSVAATEAMDYSRVVMAGLINADPDEIHFGPSTSQNTYVLARALRPMWHDGDEIIVTNQDHEANSGVWRRLAESGIVVKQWGVDPATGLLDPTDLDDLITERTRMVAVTHASNVAATVNPIREIADKVHKVGGIIVVDGVSYAPHAAIDVRSLDCDVYLYSAYKTFGPHIGMLYTRRSLLDQVENQGHFFNADHRDAFVTPAGPDHAIIGAAAGVGVYFDDLHRHQFGPTELGRFERLQQLFKLVARHEEALMTPLLGLLNDRSGVHIVGVPEPDHARRAPTIAFFHDSVESAAIYRALIEAKVSCGHGHFYAHRLVTALGLEPDDGVVRLSMVHYNTESDVQRTLEVLDRVL